MLIKELGLLRVTMRSMEQAGLETALTGADTQELRVLLSEVLLLHGKLPGPSKRRKPAITVAPDPLVVAAEYLVSKEYESDLHPPGCAGCFPFILALLILPCFTYLDSSIKSWALADWFVFGITALTLLVCWYECSRFSMPHDLFEDRSAYMRWLSLVRAPEQSVHNLWGSLPIGLRTILLGKLPRTRLSSIRALIQHIAWYTAESRHPAIFGSYAYSALYIWLLINIVRNWTLLFGDLYNLADLPITGPVFWAWFAVVTTTVSRQNSNRSYLIKHLHDGILALENRDASGTEPASPPAPAAV